MDIKEYNYNLGADEFRLLLRKKYGDKNNFGYFIKEFGIAWNFCINNRNIDFYPLAGFENGELVAHIALIVDKRLPKGQAFFGFMEMPEDNLLIESIWHKFVENAKSKGISLLKGPVNGSIWHQYRCIKKTSELPLFKFEPFSELFYCNFLLSQKPVNEIVYFSAFREPYDIVLKLVDSSSFDALERYGFSIKVTKKATSEEMKKIADISRVVFKENWGYTELDDSEFFDLYSVDKLSDYLDSLYLLYKDKEIIGFCTTSKEDESTLLLKTICVLPAYRGLGLGNALAYKIHLDAKNEGFKRIVYALIREGNSINNFPKDGVVIFRNYSAFEYQI